MSHFFSANNLYRTDLCGISAYPFTFSGWVYTTTTATNQCWAGFGDTNATAAQMGYLRDPPDGDAGVFARSLSPATSAADGTTNTFSTSTWHHVLVVFTSAVSRTVYLDGAGVTTNITSVTFDSNMDKFSIGNLYYNSSTPFAFAGYIAEVAIWDTTLSGSNIAILADGRYPDEVDAGNLISYWPLLLDVDDAHASYDLTKSAEAGPVSNEEHPAMNSVITISAAGWPSVRQTDLDPLTWNETSKTWSTAYASVIQGRVDYLVVIGEQGEIYFKEVA